MGGGHSLSVFDYDVEAVFGEGNWRLVRIVRLHLDFASLELELDEVADYEYVEEPSLVEVVEPVGELVLDHWVP